MVSVSRRDHTSLARTVTKDSDAMFDALEEIAVHPVAALYLALARDPNPEKVDLGIGVYRDSQGRSPIMGSVRQAMQRLAEKQKTKEYISPGGNRRYSRHMEQLVLGESHSALRDKRVVTYQTPGAGGGLRIAAEVVHRATPNARIWVSDPTWEHQVHVVDAANVPTEVYPYFDRSTNRLQFDRMVTALRRIPAGDVLLLHGCCHNPTGEDLTREQWQIVAEICERQGIIPFIDLVYQGFGDGIEEDAFGARLIAQICSEAIIVTSSSKSFGIYRDRAGTVSLVTRTNAGIANTERHLSSIAGGLYFMPPDFGAALVTEILEDETLRGQWRAELETMRTRIVGLRARFRKLLQQKLQHRNFDFLERQKGMFSLLPLSTINLADLQSRHSVYMMPDARINLAALTEERVERVVDAIADVLAMSPRETVGEHQ
jgi:aspartate aminotransferase